MSNTSEIERDFVFKKVGGICHNNPERPVVMIGFVCGICPHYKCKKGGFILCDGCDKDDDGYEDVKNI
jgi:hypothetical protein